MVNFIHRWTPTKKQKIAPGEAASISTDIPDPIGTFADYGNDHIPSFKEEDGGSAIPGRPIIPSDNDCEILTVYMPNNQYDRSKEDRNVNYWPDEITSLGKPNATHENRNSQSQYDDRSLNVIV